MEIAGPHRNGERDAAIRGIDSDDFRRNPAAGRNPIRGYQGVNIGSNRDLPGREGSFRMTEIGQLLLLAIAAWTATYSRLILGPLQEAMRQSMSISDNRMAILQGSAIAIPMAVGAIPVGLLADRISRKGILL